MRTRVNRSLGLSVVVAWSVGLGVPSSAGSDGYLVRPGLTCRGKTPKFSSVVVQVLYQGVQDVAHTYRLRYIQGQKENGSDAETALTFDRVFEFTPAPALRSYRGESGGESADLTIRLMDQSDQNLGGNLKIVRADGSVEVIPRLSCNRTRP